MTSINEPAPAVNKIEEFLRALLSSSGLDLKFQIITRTGNAPASSSPEDGEPSRPADQSLPSPEILPLSPGTPEVPLAPPAVTPRSPEAPLASPDISVEFTGPDTPLLVARNGELLHAIEHLAAKALRLEPEQHDRISFDAENFKLLRNRELELIAQAAVEKVRATGRPYSFPPMNSRERRLLHLALSASGLPTASTGLGPRRFVVLYPEGQEPAEPPRQPSTHDRTRAIRNSFRRR